MRGIGGREVGMWCRGPCAAHQDFAYQRRADRGAQHRGRLHGAGTVRENLVVVPRQQAAQEPQAGGSLSATARPTLKWTKNRNGPRVQAHTRTTVWPSRTEPARHCNV